MSSIDIETAVTCVGSVFVGLTDGMLSQLIWYVSYCISLLSVVAPLLSSDVHSSLPKWTLLKCITRLHGYHFCGPL